MAGRVASDLGSGGVVAESVCQRVRSDRQGHHFPLSQRPPRSPRSLVPGQLLAIRADAGQPVTPAVREHVTGLHLRALQVAHPHQYRVRLVSDPLEIAVTGKVEAERYARTLEDQLAERNRQVSELAEDKGRLRAAWDADRADMQAEYERLAREISEITSQLRLARKRAARAEQRCQVLEGILDASGWDPGDLRRRASFPKRRQSQTALRRGNELAARPGPRTHPRLSYRRELLVFSQTVRLCRQRGKPSHRHQPCVHRGRHG